VNKRATSTNVDTDLTDWARVDAQRDDDIDLSDSPEWTDAKFAKAQHRGPQKAPLKQPISIRLSPEVIEYFKAEGPGWQTRIDAVLREYMRAHA
jgi:uncharacterized protein (DUF4415 family)